jgi:SAP domain-containing new25/Domain of unknown function (DUF6434)
MTNNLLQEFKTCYFMKKELINLCRQLNLSTDGSKSELNHRIELFILDKNEKKNLITIPKQTPPKLTLETKLKEGYKCDEKTRNFFKKHIGEHFHFTYFLNEYIKQHPNKTYGDAIKFWKYQNEHKDQFTQKYTETGKFEYNNFVKKYYEAHPHVTLEEIIHQWNKHKEKRNKKCKHVITKLLNKKN